MFRAGTGKSTIECFYPGIGMMGYGQFHNVVNEQATPLWARAIFLQDNEQNSFFFVNLEIAFITLAIKEEVLKRLSELHPEWQLGAERLVLTAQHTHSAPGGYSHYPFYNFTIPGFQPRLFDEIIKGIIHAMEEAYRSEAPAELIFGEVNIGADKEVAFNRSIKAHLNNPDKIVNNEQDTHLAIDRKMQGLKILSPEGEFRGFVSWFGVHATSISSFNQKIHHDNKGVAAHLFEKAHPGVVAIFAQGSAGDVSPNFIWDKKLKRMRGKYKDQYESAAFNGELQFREAQRIQGEKIEGKIKCLHLFSDMALMATPAAHGLAFFQGTLEGPGMSPLLSAVIRPILQKVSKAKKKKASADDQKFYQEQEPKEIMLDHRTGEFLGIPLAVWKKLPPLPDPSAETLRKHAKKESINTLPWVPHVLPFQIVCFGPLLIAAVPGEITTTAGQRLKEMLQQELADSGVEKVIISSYSNAYMGYVTTAEEYDLQCYEGGHTIYGRRTLSAFIQAFSQLAHCFKNQNQLISAVPFHFPPEELARRTSG